MSILFYDQDRQSIKSLDLTDVEGFLSQFGTDPHGNGQPSARPSELYRKEGFFKRCVDLRARSAASLPVSIRDTVGEQVWANTDKGVQMPDSLSWLDIGQYLFKSEASLVLFGIAMHFADGDIRESDGQIINVEQLKYLSPESTEPCFDKGPYGPGPDGEFRYYKRQVGSGTYYIPRMAVIEVFQPDPTVEQGKGASDAMAASLASQVLLDLQGYTSQQLRNGIMKKVLLTADKDARMPDESMLKKMKDFASRVVFRPNRQQNIRSDEIVFFQGIKPEIIGMSLAELESKQLSEVYRESVAASLGIPLSMVLSNAANYATALESRIDYYSSTVIPQARLSIRALNKKLAGLGYRATIDEEKMDMFIEMELAKSEKVLQLAGRPLISVAEGREMLDKPTADLGEGAFIIAGQEETTPEAAPQIFAKGDIGWNLYRSDAVKCTEDLERWKKVAKKKGRFAPFSPDHMTAYEISAIYDALSDETKTIDDALSIATIETRL